MRQKGGYTCPIEILLDTSPAPRSTLINHTKSSSLKPLPSPAKLWHTPGRRQDDPFIQSRHRNSGVRDSEGQPAIRTPSLTHLLESPRTNSLHYFSTSITTASEKLRLFGKYLPILLQLLYQRLQASIRRLTYRPPPTSQNALVLGGSFTGAYLALQLTKSLLSGYKVILIKKNTHFNYTFNFLWYSVL